MLEFNKGDKVKIKSVTRTRTIFQGAEVSPGTTSATSLDVTGTVNQVFEDPLTSYEVEIDGGRDGQNFIEVSPNELEKICVCDYPDRSSMTWAEWEAADGHFNQADGYCCPHHGNTCGHCHHH